MKTNLLVVIPILLLVSSCQTRYAYQKVNTPEALSISTELSNQDSTALALISPYKEKMGDKLDEVIGELDKDMPTGGYGSESLLGNLTSNLLIDFGFKYNQKLPDLAVVNFGGLRRSLYNGPLKVSDIYELMPFDNMVVILELDGETVKKMFEYAIEDGGITIAGAILYTKEGKFNNAKIGDNLFNPKETYTLVISDYLANGGGNMTFLAEAKSNTNTGVMLRDAIIEFCKDKLAKGEKISSTLEGRIIKDSSKL